MKKILINIFLTTTILGISLITLDFILYKTIPPAYSHTKYGWTVPANTVEKRLFWNTPDYQREIINEYSKYGFKRWGDETTNKLKIFIIGDSFTQTTQVHNGEEWFSYIEGEFPNAELFVYGANGYNTTQELLILQDFLPIIRPDIIIWQFTQNDYVENVHALDKKVFPYNNHAVRPYLENGQIVYRLPLLLSEARLYSRILDYGLKNYEDKVFLKNFIFVDAINIMLYGWEKRPTPPIFSPEEVSLGLFATIENLTLVKKTTDKIPIYFFNSGILINEEKNVCHSLSITCIEGVGEEVEKYKNQGEIVEGKTDKHWNTKGNEIVGKFLVNYFNNNEEFQNIYKLKSK